MPWAARASSKPELATATGAASGGAGGPGNHELALRAADKESEPGYRWIRSATGVGWTYPLMFSDGSGPNVVSRRAAPLGIAEQVRCPNRP